MSTSGSTHANQPVLLASTNISSSSQGSALVGNVGDSITLGALVWCKAVPAGGSPTLDVYLQTSIDGGTTWVDMAHHQFTGAVDVQLMSFTRDSDYLTRAGPHTKQTRPVSDAALAGDTVLSHISWGDRIRLKWVFAAGGSSGNFTLQSWCALH